MKELLLLKRVDLLAQLLAIVIPIIMGVITLNGGYLFIIYFSLGTVQALSCIVNRIFLNKGYRNRGRDRYEILLLIIVVLGTLALLDANGVNENGGYFALLYLYFFVIAGFVLGIGYMVISIQELSFISKLVKRHELIK